MRVGVVGHRCLAAEGSSFVVAACARLMADLRNGDSRLTALSALAEGADTLFARVAVALKVPLEVVQPHADYLDDFRTTVAQAEYGVLWAVATRRTAMPYRRRSDSAYQAAMRWIVDRSDLVVAIWDGRSSTHIGGTAHTVCYAHGRGRPIAHVNPVARNVAIG